MEQQKNSKQFMDSKYLYVDVRPYLFFIVYMEGFLLLLLPSIFIIYQFVNFMYRLIFHLILDVEILLIKQQTISMLSQKRCKQGGDLDPLIRINLKKTIFLMTYLCLINKENLRMTTLILIMNRQSPKSNSIDSLSRFKLRAFFQYKNLNLYIQMLHTRRTSTNQDRVLC